MKLAAGSLHVSYRWSVPHLSYSKHAVAGHITKARGCPSFLSPGNPRTLCIPRRLVIPLNALPATRRASSLARIHQPVLRPYQPRLRELGDVGVVVDVEMAVDKVLGGAVWQDQQTLYYQQETAHLRGRILLYRHHAGTP